MLKGAQKRMYVVKLGEDSMFEEAYFVLKREKGTAQGSDMVSEATRIIRQSMGQEEKPSSSNKRWQHALIGFALGALSGAGITLVLCLLL
ncbi:MAG: hypothetical protein IJW70_00210 [Clostridia bacterium]|nr:hypothetical protein [Clostridia bacterium]